MSSVHSPIVEKAETCHDFRCLASWPGPSLVPCSHVSRGRCPEAIVQAASPQRMTSSCRFSRLTKARQAAVSSWSRPRGAYLWCWRGLSTRFTSTGGSLMTGSWGQSLVDRSHTDCICTTEPRIWHGMPFLWHMQISEGKLIARCPETENLNCLWLRVEEAVA